LTHFSNSMIRLFIGIPLPASVQSLLPSWQSALQRDLKFQKWTHPEDVHITLFFLGDVAPEIVPAMEAELLSIAAETAPFGLRADGLGVFGPPAAPSILWAGIEGDKAQLSELQRLVAGACARQGFAAESRGYRPHVTLARRYRGTGPFQRAALARAAQPAGGWPTWQVQDIVLYQSHLGRSPSYEPLVVIPLGG
jgi:2'-5' RNA ligase